MASWNDLQRELDYWQAQSQTATFWWRDDDAIEDTPALQRLLTETADCGVGIAVIPADLKPCLPSAVAVNHHAWILQHGYDHCNYAPPRVKKMELGEHRAIDVLSRQLSFGYEQLAEAFSEQFIPVLVPPWNRYTTALIPHLNRIGLTGVSAMWGRRYTYPAPHVLQVNTHVDPIAWREDRGYVGDDQALGQVIKHLIRRRIGSDVWRYEPTGLLTHHLVQDEATWGFCRQLQRFIAAHPAGRWLSPADIFEPAKQLR